LGTRPSSPPGPPALRLVSSGKSFDYFAFSQKHDWSGQV